MMELNRLIAAITFLVVLLMSCNQEQSDNSNSDFENPNMRLPSSSYHNTSVGSIESHYTDDSNFQSIVDSIYVNQNYSFKLIPPDNKDESNRYKNRLFEFSVSNKPVFADSVMSPMCIIKFKDFSGDGLEDILIYENSSVTSEWYYNLYVVDTLQNTLKKIRGFNKIGEPYNYLPEYNLFDNSVTAGTHWSRFYQIQGDSVFDFHITVRQGVHDDGSVIDFEKEYKDSLKSVLKHPGYIAPQ